MYNCFNGRIQNMSKLNQVAFKLQLKNYYYQESDLRLETQKVQISVISNRSNNFNFDF